MLLFIFIIFYFSKRSHREISEKDKKDMQQMYDVGILSRNIMQYMTNQVGGLAEISYFNDDMKYHLISIDMSK